MDSWTEREIKAMQVGGNKQMNDFLKEHGVPKNCSIKKKYNSRAAALYREVYALSLHLTPAFLPRSRVASLQPLSLKMIPPPSFLSPPSITSRELNEEDEDPIQRELRLRAEAKERLQKKFGAGGLKSQAVGSSPIPPGGYGQQPSSPQPGDEYSNPRSAM